MASNHLFLRIKEMQDIVKSQRNKFEMGDLNQQYLISKHVNLDDFVKIDDVRDSIGKHIGMTNYLDIYLLIVKIPRWSIKQLRTWAAQWLSCFV
jgi:hypothetical protein